MHLTSPTTVPQLMHAPQNNCWRAVIEAHSEITGFPGDQAAESTQLRVQPDGKFFRLGRERWLVHGLTYGPFPVNEQGDYLPSRALVGRDLRQIASLGANCIRVYHVPPRWLLDDALECRLRVFVDVPWEKHRCFFQDWSAQEDARKAVRAAANQLGDHPGLFAISVANEFPPDIVRFHGYRRVERFVDELIDVVKQASPQCLATFANYPTTEFLTPRLRDFVCFNVYLDSENSLARYLDRLQHLAGPLPLMLGEYGTDSIRHGESAQAESVARHVRTAFRHGLAGSFVFSYCDEWFTGGSLVHNWAFGITRRDRSEKPAAAALKRAWSSRGGVVDATDNAAVCPRVSVVVCSYNGAATLAECLRSLHKLNYRDYEVILVDDGSTDDTPAIAQKFPWVRCIRQVNMGLSVARNVGARAATGKIVAYTDSDCVADPDWLHHLIGTMRRLGVSAIGGPNLPPPSDSLVAQCVAASPGGPSHVMFDDQLAEHVPGCNMAFDRDVLLAMGGFDAQFRQAGDDVDVCWRLLDAGQRIGFAAGAMVWHHRRTSVRAYLKQQKGYGRSEAMLSFKHAQRFNTLGCSLWNGVIYGEGAVGLPIHEPVIYHGRHGGGLFQTIYTRQQYTFRAYTTLLEWHALAAFILAMSAMAPALAWISAVMWMLTLISIVRAGCTAPLRPGTPLWCRALVVLLHLLQPPVRAWHRYRHRMLSKPSLRPSRFDAVRSSRFRRIDIVSIDGCWSSESGRGREQLLLNLETMARHARLPGIFDHAWQSWDMSLFINRCWNVQISTATEELGNSKRFTRVRCTSGPTTAARVIIGAAIIWFTVAVICQNQYAIGAGAVCATVIGLSLYTAMRRASVTAASLVDRAAAAAGLRRYTLLQRKRRHPRRPAPTQPLLRDSDFADCIQEVGADVA